MWQGRRLTDSGCRDEVLLYSEVREDLPAFGHQCETFARHAVDGQSVESNAVNRHRAGRDGQQPEDALDCRRPTHADAAEQRDYLPLSYVKRDVKEGLGVAVGGLQPKDGEESAHIVVPRRQTASSPRYTARTSGWQRISAGLPVNMTLP